MTTTTTTGPPPAGRAHPATGCGCARPLPAGSSPQADPAVAVVAAALAGIPPANEGEAAIVRAAIAGYQDGAAGRRWSRQHAGVFGGPTTAAERAYRQAHHRATTARNGREPVYG